MTDLLVAVPSRGRPASVDRLVRACALTCRADTRLHFAFDDDDPQLEASIAAAAGHPYTTGPRDTLTGWTNKIAAANPAAPAYASLGDDHLPVTDGWDACLLDAVRITGGGYAYPNDMRRDDIPEAVVISADIVAALGWLSPPFLTHWYQDNVWADLGRAAGCLTYCRTVIVRHLHPTVTGAPGDATYGDAAVRFDADLAAYQRWRLTRMTADIALIREARGGQSLPVRYRAAGAAAAHRVAGPG